MDDQLLLLLSPPVRWVHLLNTLLWPASAALGLWRARRLVRRRSKRAAYALPDPGSAWQREGQPAAPGAVIGAEDMVFPRLNAISYWFIPAGVGVIVASPLLGGFQTTGWTGYAPLGAVGAPGQLLY